MTIPNPIMLVETRTGDPLSSCNKLTKFGPQSRGLQELSIKASGAQGDSPFAIAKTWLQLIGI